MYAAVLIVIIFIGMLAVVGGSTLFQKWIDPSKADLGFLTALAVLIIANTLLQAFRTNREWTQWVNTIGLVMILALMWLIAARSRADGQHRPNLAKLAVLAGYGAVILLQK
jgi:chromate transport protein ChrA